MMDHDARPFRILWLSLLLAASWPTAPAARGAFGPVQEQEDDRESRTIERFRALLERSPRRGTALDRVYGHHVERGTLDELIGEYRDRVAKDKGDGVAWMLIGLLESQRGNDAAAVEALKRAAETRPEDPLPSYYQGQALVLIGQPDQAAEAFEEAIRRKPSRADQLEIYQSLGRLYQRAHRVEEALGVWKRLEAQFPDDLRVQEQIALAMAEEGQHEQALSRYEIMARKADDPYRRVQFQMDAAELKVRLGKADAALHDYETLLGQLNPESWLHREVRRKIEEVFLRTDDQAGLAKYYESWIEKHPQDVDAMARLGRTLSVQGRAEEARGWLDKAVKLAPTDGGLRRALIEQLVQEHDIAGASSQYEALAEARPGDPDILREWGLLLLRDPSKTEAERRQAAAKVWRKLVEAHPDDAATATQVADLMRQAELVDEAIALYEKAIQIAPDQPQYREYLGEYYHTLKRSEEALATWEQIADGPNRTSKNLGRLAEVLAGFGYPEKALAAVAEARAMDPRDFDLALKHADLLRLNDKYDEALKALDAAEPLALDEEQSAAALESRVETLQAAGTLLETAETLRKELEAGKDATPARWIRLARYLEAAGRLPEAQAAIEKVLAREPDSIAAWSASARVHEVAGNLGAAAEAYRKLATIDRRSRTDYLTEVAKLEARLGRRDEALQAGRDLLAAAPGNPESYQFFAELCFGLGFEKEGFDALRRAVRVNPSDTKALLSLASNLAERFRTEEAIELYWRAFERTTDIEEKLGLIAQLTELYLRRSQFDSLISRLERAGREADKQREMAFCLAQAYSTSGDFGQANAELERLLAENPRDTQLLQQMSALAESEGDIETAAKYQEQLNQIAPSDEGRARLAQLYVRSGQSDEAEALWTSLAQGGGEPEKILQALDSLLDNNQYESALIITGRLLSRDPDDWEALLREGVALQSLDRDEEAAARFQALLDLNLPDDKPSAEAKARKQRSGALGRPAGTASSSSLGSQVPAIQHRIQMAYRARVATGLDPRSYAYPSQYRQVAPDDFGMARMFALGYLDKQAIDAGGDAEFLESAQARAEAADRNDPRAAWDLYYLQVLRSDMAAAHEAARQLAERATNDPQALYVYLSSLSTRTAQPGVQVAQSPRPGAKDTTPPLPDAELDRMMASFETLRSRRPDLLTSTVLSSISTELKRAGRDEQGKAFFEKVVATASTLETLQSALTLAAERGDVEQALALFDKVERLSTGRTSTRSSILLSDDPAIQLARLISTRAEAGSPADSRKVLDHYLETARLQRQQTAAGYRLRSRRVRNMAASQSYIATWKNGTQQYTRLDYPSPNEFFDGDSIQVLWQTYQAHKEADLLSDLEGHLQERAESAQEADAIVLDLALCAVAWWSGDKDTAVDRLADAVEASSGDVDLTLDLAAMREKQEEREEALALIETIEPMDNATLQAREVMALRLAVRLGDVERARTAAERLFNLRLDTDLQIQLAAQMHQLGMHDLAEAVLGRARRRAGRRTDTLASLMAQYQRQNQNDVAVQVAHQILRRTRPSSRVANGSSSQEETARREAIAVLARSGKIDDLIERAEAQIKVSPNSVALHQMLADYYQAAGRRDDVKKTYLAIAEMRPDDAALQYQVAQQLASAGDNDAAIERYKVAIARNPALFANQYWNVQNTFTRANRLDELVKLLETIDLKQLGRSYMVLNMVQSLVRNESTREQGLTLFRRAWEAFPSERSNMLANFYDDAIWKLPEMYDYARQAIIPSKGQTVIQPWAGVYEVRSYSSGGHANSLLEHLIDSATEQGRLAELTAEVRARLEERPDWSGGKAILGVILVRQGKPEEARPFLEETIEALKEQTDNTRALFAAWIIGQELEDSATLRPLAEALYHLILNDAPQGRRIFDQYSISPANRLVAMLKEQDRNEEAREIVLKFTEPQEDPSGINAGYYAYQSIQNLQSVGNELIALGYPADAVRAYASLLGDDDMLREAQAYYSGRRDFGPQIEAGLLKALDALDGDSLLPTLEALIAPSEPKTDDPEEKRSRDEDDPAIDLVLMVQPHELDRAALTSLFARAIEAAGDREEVAKEIEGRLEGLKEDHPDDLSVMIAEALLADGRDDDAAFSRAVDRLGAWVEAHPLEDLGPKGRANARQRAEAARQLGLWLVARACWDREEAAEAADRLAERAIDAARRQSEPNWTLAMLRERGQRALDRGDRKAAERYWGAMLETVIGPKEAPKTRGSRADAARLIAPATVPLILLPQASALGGPSRTPATATPMAPPTTLDQFEKAGQIAELAARNGLTELSLRAIRESLSAGPPVEGADRQFGLTTSRSVSTVQVSGITIDAASRASEKVEEQVHRLDRLWSEHEVPPVAIYEALADAVLPEGRPDEIFLYNRPLVAVNRSLASGGFSARSVSGFLARAAVASDRVGDLRERVAARREKPLAELPALILLGQLSIEQGDAGEAGRLLEKLRERLERDSLWTSAELACHMALPALKTGNAEDQAIAVVEQVTRNLRGQPQELAMLSLHTFLAERYFQRGDVEAGRRAIEAYLDASNRTMPNYSDSDSIVYVRKGAIQKAALEYLEADLLADALELLGRAADLPPTSRRDLGSDGWHAVLVRKLMAQPAAERYELLRDWTLPAENRRSVRLLAAFLPESQPPDIFGVSPILRDDGGIPGGASRIDPRGSFSNIGLLIDAAREAGTLDALAASARSAAEEGVAHGKLLQALVELARGNAIAAKPIVEEFQAAIAEKHQDRESATDNARTNSATNNTRVIGWDDYLITHASLADPALQSAGMAMLRDLIGLSEMSRAGDFLAHLNRERAEWDARQAGGSPVPGADPGLALWTPSSLVSNQHRTEGVPPAWWVAHDGHIALVAGPPENDLFLNVPLEGSFTFSIDAYNGDSAASQVAFGGLIYAPMAETSLRQVMTHGGYEHFNLPCRLLRQDSFNTYTLKVEPGKVTCLINGIPWYEDASPSSISPWLALCSTRGRRSVYRNPRITGRPTIPDEVHLTQGDRLDGWSTRIFSGSQPPTRHLNPDPDPNEQVAIPKSPEEVRRTFDWSSIEGEVVGRRQESDGIGHVESLLTYARPLLNGERIRYEFFYEPGKMLVHPALGRLAFLLDPGGVNLHWITGNVHWTIDRYTRSADSDWTGLGLDNAVAEPGYRRSGDSLPLKPDAWNVIEVALAGDVATLTLNGSTIYECPVPPDNDRHFGLFHYQDREEARVRNVVLTGDWPDALPDDLLARRDGDPDPAERLARHAMIGESFSVQEAWDLLQRTQDLPADSRYEALAAWVLPNSDHPTIRLTGDFTPTDPAPPVAPEVAVPDGATRLRIGGALVAPALALVRASAEAGTLEELAGRVDAIDPKTPLDRRGQAALQALIGAARGDEERALQAIARLKPLLEAVPQDAPDWQRWPELVVSAASLERPALRAATRPLLDFLVEKQVPQSESFGDLLERQTRHIRAVAQWKERPESANRPFGMPPESSLWRPVSLASAETRGRGFPIPHWTVGRDGGIHLPGHADDFLDFGVPLRGDFEVSCELSAAGGRMASIVYNDLWVGLNPERDKLEIGHAWGRSPDVTLDQPIEAGDWYPYRLVVKDGRYAAYIKDRKVYEASMPTDPDPWLAIYAQGSVNGGARNLKISGHPTIPEALDLSQFPNLTGWSARYFGESISGKTPDWSKNGGEIVGHRVESPRDESSEQDRPANTGLSAETRAPRESLLQYHRPMLEDGRITFEFFYTPGRSAVHPALDRLVFLLEPDGVKIHWLTDGIFDRTGLKPDNATVEPENRRGPDKLPLKPDDWNRLELALEGDTVTLTLNGAAIYERDLEPTNSRTFGLFHDASRDEARVRNVSYTGDWPRTLPDRLELSGD